MEVKFIDVVFERCKTLAETRIILALAGVYGIDSKKRLIEVTQLAKANLYNALNTLLSNGDIVYNGIYSLNETIYPYHTTQGIETIPTPATQGIETIPSAENATTKTKPVPTYTELVNIWHKYRFSPITLQRCYNGYLRSKSVDFGNYAETNRHKYTLGGKMSHREKKRKMALEWIDSFKAE